MAWIDLLVAFCLIVFVGYMILRTMRKRRYAKAHPGCASGCCGCTQCPTDQNRAGA